MQQDRIVVGTGRTPGPDRGRIGEYHGRAWRAVAVIGVAFVLAGLADLGLAGFRPQFGDPAWRFATLTTMAGGLPVLGVGASAWVVAGVATGSRGLLLSGLFLNGVLLVLLLVGVGGLASSASTAIALTPPEVHLGLRKALIKGLVFGGAFAVVHAVGAQVCWRGLRGGGNTA